MRPLLLNDKIKADIAHVVEYAIAPENLYDPGISPQPPGDDARHVVLVPIGFRCVFSITQSPDDRLYRHLSISVNARDRYPNEHAAFMLADLFGFTGWNKDATGVPGKDWMIDINREKHCIVLAQSLPKDILPITAMIDKAFKSLGYERIEGEDQCEEND